MSTKNTIVTMRMQVTVEFKVDTWDAGTMKFSDIREIALKEGRQKLMEKMQGTQISVVETPFVRAIMVEG